MEASSPPTFILVLLPFVNPAISDLALSPSATPTLTPSLDSSRHQMLQLYISQHNLKVIADLKHKIGSGRRLVHQATARLMHSATSTRVVARKRPEAAAPRDPLGKV